ncbi:hypothetical protein F5B21DRAFT_528124 [Xylaria acuta]|nr:hypothetical protein F5B21DRAFT_528124 [Xylaria acuta]
MNASLPRRCTAEFDRSNTTKTAVRSIKILSINWDIDMFYFRSGLHLTMHMALNGSCVQKMKRIAIEIRGPKVQGGTPWIFARRILESVTTIILVLSFKAVRNIYKQWLAGKQVDDNEQDKAGESELEMESDSDNIDEEEDGEVVFDPYQRLARPPSEGPIWLHHVEAESRCYFKRPLIYLFGRRAPRRQVTISFRDWVDKAIFCASKDSGRNFCGRPVDIHMAMDLTGSYDFSIQSYYKGFVGVYPIEKSVSEVSREDS